MALAPFHVDICALKFDDPPVRETATGLHDELVRRGWDCLLDDRDERPGVKFADAELLGPPVRITVGGRSLKEGVIEVRTRRDGADRLFPLAGAAEALDALLAALAEEESR
jgi:prolyl-tRNA synthetase